MLKITNQLSNNQTNNLIHLTYVHLLQGIFCQQSHYSTNTRATQSSQSSSTFVLLFSLSLFFSCSSYLCRNSDIPKSRTNSKAIRFIEKTSTNDYSFTTGRGSKSKLTIRANLHLFSFTLLPSITSTLSTLSTSLFTRFISFSLGRRCVTYKNKKKHQGYRCCGNSYKTTQDKLLSHSILQNCFPLSSIVIKYFITLTNNLKKEKKKLTNK